ncbi:MAG: phosphoribosylpyrophosphate synthetase [Acidimicrobiia bacterium]|jgi:hypothetical protein
MDVPETVTEAVRLLEAKGFRGDFRIDRGTLHCSSCGHLHRPAKLVVHETFRFEGATDPGDEAIVLGVECPRCGTLGIVVSAFGPDADDGLIGLTERLERPPD